MLTTPESRRANSKRAAETVEARKNKQWALVAYLLAGLLLVVVIQPSSEPADHAIGRVAPTLKVNPVGASNAYRNGGDPLSRFSQTRELPRIPVDQTRSMDLFRKTYLAPQPEPVLLTEPIIAPMAEPIVEPIVETIVETIADPVIEPVAEPVIESVAGPITEPLAEPITEPVAEPEKPEPKSTITVGAVYGSFESKTQSALIDGKIRRAGERLDDGIQILSVTADGVKVAP